MQLRNDRQDVRVLRWPRPRLEPVASDVDDLSIEALVARLESFAVERQHIHQAIEDAEARARACFDSHDAAGVQEQFDAIERSRGQLAELKAQEQSTQDRLDRKIEHVLAEWQVKAEVVRDTWQAEQSRVLARIDALIHEIEECLTELASLPAQVAGERERLLRERAALLARGGRYATQYPPPNLDLDPIDVVALGERLAALAQQT